MASLVSGQGLLNSGAGLIGNQLGIPGLGSALSFAENPSWQSGINTALTIGGSMFGMPWLGTAAGLLEGMFGKGGGPKGGGYAEIGGDGTGQFSDLYGGTGTDRGYTPNTDDSSISSFLTNLDNTYNTDLSKLGLKADPATFALGYDTDPNGTASDRYTGGVMVGGKEYDQAKDVSTGRDPTTFNTDIGQYSNSMLDAALTAAGANSSQIAGLNTPSNNANLPLNAPPGTSNNSSLLPAILSGLGATQNKNQVIQPSTTPASDFTATPGVSDQNGQPVTNNNDASLLQKIAMGVHTGGLGMT